MDLISVIATLAGTVLTAQLRDTVTGWLTEARANLAAAQRQKQVWTRLHYILGVPAAILGGAAGVTSIAAAPVWVSATLAFASAGASSGYVFLRPNAKAIEAGTLIGAQQEVVRSLEIALAVDLAGADSLDPTTARKLLRQLAKQQAEADGQASSATLGSLPGAQPLPGSPAPGSGLTAP